MPEAHVLLFDRLLGVLPAVDRRKMFGCPCAFVNGNMFAGLHEHRMILRLDANDRRRLIESKKARPFAPFAGMVLKEYVAFSGASLTARGVLSRYLRRSYSYARSLPPKAP